MFIKEIKIAFICCKTSLRNRRGGGIIYRSIINNLIFNTVKYLSVFRVWYLIYWWYTSQYKSLLSWQWSCIQKSTCFVNSYSRQPKLPSSVGKLLFSFWLDLFFIINILKNEKISINNITKFRNYLSQNLTELSSELLIPSSYTNLYLFWSCGLSWFLLNIIVYKSNI